VGVVVRVYDAPDGVEGELLGLVGDRLALRGFLREGEVEEEVEEEEVEFFFFFFVRLFWFCFFSKKIEKAWRRNHSPNPALLAPALLAHALSLHFKERVELLEPKAWSTGAPTLEAE